MSPADAKSHRGGIVKITIYKATTPRWSQWLARFGGNETIKLTDKTVRKIIELITEEARF